MTVVVCTHNRASLLNKCLESISNQLNINDLDVLVVDNASTDNTVLVVDDWKAKIKGVRYAYESKPGIANARNCGLNLSRSVYTAYLDDDVIAAPDWAINIYNGIHNNNADEAGGRTTVYWDRKRPIWITAEMYPLLGESDHGTGLIADSDDYIPNGANMAFLTASAEAAGGFPIDLGISATDGIDKTVFLGEETSLGRNIKMRGGTVVYVGNAHVRHYVSPDRCSIPALFKRARLLGNTGVIIDNNHTLSEYSEGCVWAGAAALSSFIRLSWRSSLAYHLLSAISYAAMKSMLLNENKKYPPICILAASSFKIRTKLLGIAKRTILGPKLPFPSFGNNINERDKHC